MRAWNFNLKLPKKMLNTFVYSDTGTDISERFVPYTVTDIKEIDDTEIPIYLLEKADKRKEK